MRRDSSELTRRLGREPAPGRISFYAELGGEVKLMIVYVFDDFKKNPNYNTSFEYAPQIWSGNRKDRCKGLFSVPNTRSAAPKLRQDLAIEFFKQITS